MCDKCCTLAGESIGDTRARNDDQTLYLIEYSVPNLDIILYMIFVILSTGQRRVRVSYTAPLHAFPVSSVPAYARWAICITGEFCTEALINASTVWH